MIQVLYLPREIKLNLRATDGQATIPFSLKLEWITELSQIKLSLTENLVISGLITPGSMGD